MRRPGLRRVVQTQVRKGWMHKRLRMMQIKCTKISTWITPFNAFLVLPFSPTNRIRVPCSWGRAFRKHRCADGAIQSLSHGPSVNIPRTPVSLPFCTPHVFFTFPPLSLSCCSPSLSFFPSLPFLSRGGGHGLSGSCQPHSDPASPPTTHPLSSSRRAAPGCVCGVPTTPGTTPGLRT